MLTRGEGRRASPERPPSSTPRVLPRPRPAPAADTAGDGSHRTHAQRRPRGSAAQGGSDRERLSRAVRGAGGDEAEPKGGQPGAAEVSPPSVHFRVLPCVCMCACVRACVVPECMHVGCAHTCVRVHMRACTRVNGCAHADVCMTVLVFTYRCTCMHV